MRRLWSEELYAPERVYSFIFQDLKRIAETRLHHPVQEVVVTVPTYFDDAQKEAIKNAAALAGLDVIRFIKESIATVEAYDLDYKNNNACGQDEECVFVVYHHEETESYAAVMSCDLGVFEVLGIVRGNDAHLER